MKAFVTWGSLSILVVLAFLLLRAQTPVNQRSSPCNAVPSDSRDGEIKSADLKWEFALIPPGRFVMGCSPGDDQCSVEEKPPILVEVREPFEINRYEVTQAMWKSVMGTNPSCTKGDDRPVETVMWKDVKAFLDRLNARADGYHYDLPSSGQWEYAARAGSTQPHYGSLDEIAWYDENSNRQTHPVGLKKPNAWGLYDTAGNVSEMVAFEKQVGQYLEDRGGSYTSDYRTTRVSYRLWFEQAFFSNWGRGFRCVRTRVK